MDEQTIPGAAPVLAPDRRRKVQRKRRRHVTRVKPQAQPKLQAALPDDLRGLTLAECPGECSTKACVISGRPYCAHPRKGGLQGRELADPAALDRLNRAKRALAHMAVDKDKS